VGVKFSMNEIVNLVLKGKGGLNCKNPIQHYLFVCLATYFWHDANVIEMKLKHGFKRKPRKVKEAQKGEWQ
jgi:hypothetical protein